MVYDTIHLADGAKLVGQDQYRWMYSIEMLVELTQNDAFQFDMPKSSYVLTWALKFVNFMYLHTLSMCEFNKSCPKGIITWGYNIEKSLELCAMYFEKDMVTIRCRPRCNANATGSGTHEGFSIFGYLLHRDDQLSQINLFILTMLTRNRHIELFCFSVLNKKVYHIQRFLSNVIICIYYI